EAGAITALVTCQTSQAQLELADVVIRTTYRDRSSAFTISHTGAMTALAMVAVDMGGRKDASALAGLPEAVSKALELEPQVQDLAETYQGVKWYTFAGWGPNASTAYEVALKINEAVYAVTAAFELEQFLHGPFVATTEGCLATLVSPPGLGYERSVAIARAVKETGADVMALVQEGDTEMTGVVDKALTLPPVPEFLTPIVYLVPLQILTYWLALGAGRNPDTFRLDDPQHQAAGAHYSL
ncbi:MAG: SIS domain-containing protein, partial [Dehalococcoidia bacterium]